MQHPGISVSAPWHLACTDEPTNRSHLAVAFRRVVPYPGGAMELNDLGVMIEDLKSTIQAVADGVVMANEHLTRHDARFDQLELRMDRQEGRMDRLDGRMERMEGRMDRIEQAVLDLAGDVRVLKRDVSELKTDLATVGSGDPVTRLH